MDFLSNCTSGGCGAKMDPHLLETILSDLPSSGSSNLLVGFESSDDAAVYQINEETAIVSTVDFFPPMVDDPYLFGRIAAANALSDIWAMGGTVLYALNLVCFPQKGDPKALSDMLRGGVEKVMEAGGSLCGGHSIYDHEPKYGLAVTGSIHPQKILRNNTPKENDVLILTKALGTGLVLGAQRVGLAQAADYKQATDSMQHLNYYASKKAQQFEVHACTDITGFGFCSHALEMAGSQFSFAIDLDSLPILSGAQSAAQQYLATAAGQRNRNHVGNRVNLSHVPVDLQEILFDPQTSGGLLFSVRSEDAAALLADLQQDDPKSAIIGIVEKRTDYVIDFY